MKIAILGAGIVGASFAYELSRRGADVTLLDRDPPGRGTSGTTAAYLNFFRKTPAHYGRLHVQALAHWQALVKEIGAEAALHLDGNLYWDREGADPTGEAGFATLTIRARQFGHEVRPVPLATLATLAPTLTPPLRDPALLLPDEGYVEVEPVIERLIAAASRHGLRSAFGSAVRAIERRDGGLRLVTDTAQHDVDRLVLAAGPQTAELGERLGLTLPVQRKPGVIAITSPLAQPLRHVVFSPGLSFRPTEGGRVLIAVGERYTLPDGEWPVEAQRALEATLLDALRTWVPGADGARIESLRVGVRPIPSDELPLVGFLPGWPEVYLAVSHSGINLGPLFARLGSHELLGGARDEALAPYPPSRLVSVPTSAPAPAPTPTPTSTSTSTSTSTAPSPSASASASA